MQEHISLFQTSGYGLVSETLSLVGCSHLLPLFIHISKSIKTSVLVTTRKKPLKNIAWKIAKPAAVVIAFSGCPCKPWLTIDYPNPDPNTATTQSKSLKK